MRDRVKSAKRILAVQNQLVKLSEWKLAKLQRETAALQGDQLALQEFVSRPEGLAPMMSEAAFRRGKQLQAAIVDTQAQAGKQSEHTDSMKRREKLAEELLDKVKAVAAREQEKRDLQEIIEAMPPRDDASFP